jgi:hypothetical protein
MASDASTWTPYSTLRPLMSEKPTWVPEMDQERLASYTLYEQIYWNWDKAFKLGLRGTDDKPVILPTARTIVDDTAHYLLKGLTVEAEDPNSEWGVFLTDFLDREAFFTKLNQGKTKGCIHGDWLFHITANPDKPEGKRISITLIDPASYFPIYSEDDPDELIAVDLVNQIVSPEDEKVRVHKLRYSYVVNSDDEVELDGEGAKTVLREEVILEMEGWYKGEAAKVYQTVLPSEVLEGIHTIPVYHFKNWDLGDDFGNSELKGIERVIAAKNQAASDEEITLALDGIGVWVTDASPPKLSDGAEGFWSVGPGEVLEIGQENKFERAKGVGSIEPFLDHLKMLNDELFRGSHTFLTEEIDVNTAESGVALAIKFMPTLAKIETRDRDALAILEQMFFDLKIWFEVYDEGNFVDQAVKLTLGPKLPINNTQILNELNNFLDRRIISRKYYRAEVTRQLGYTFPDGLDEEILAEERALAEARQFMSPENGEGFNNQNGNRSNNADRPNESAGTEATQDAEDQQRPTR